MVTHSYRNRYPDVVVGAEYGRLTVLTPAAPKRSGKHLYWYWNIRCVCGTEHTVRDAYLKSGHTESCGCLAREKAIGKVIHGEGSNGKETPEYISWSGMKKRVSNPNMTGFKYWGGRGIRVCQRWMTYTNFLADLGRKPTPKHSIDRKDNDGHYSCGKCSECLQNGWPTNGRWATPAEQAITRRKGNRWKRAA